MDRETLIEKAHRFCKGHTTWRRFEGEAVDDCRAECMADFALSLLQWKDVADGLPEVEGTYVVIGKYSLSPYLLEFPYELSNKWEKTVVAYIPVPISEYVKGEKQCVNTTLP